MKHGQIGLIGLGLMGSSLAERFLRRCFTVIGYDIDPKRRQALKKLGGQPVDAAVKVAARCRRVVFSLPTTDVVESVIREMDSKLGAGTVIIDTTTGEPDQTAALGAR